MYDGPVYGHSAYGIGYWVLGMCTGFLDFLRPFTALSLSTSYDFSDRSDNRLVDMAIAAARWQ